MDIKSFLPQRSLRRFIKTYLAIESREELVNRVLPGTSPTMVFRFKGEVSELSDDTKTSLAPSIISGLRKSGRLINYSKDTGNILVIFREAGAVPFFKEPLYEMFDNSVSLKNLAGYRDLDAIEDQLAEATTYVQRIALIEEFLLSRLCYDKPDELILAAIGSIHSAKGVIKIKALADSLFISLDAFEKRFRRVAAVSPKQFSYIVRMKSVIKAGITKQTLADVAFDAGYSDQPHFNKDFKLFTGLTPTNFIKSPVFW